MNKDIELPAVPWPPRLKNWKGRLPHESLEDHVDFRSEAPEESYYPCASDPQHMYGKRYKRSMRSRIR